VRGDMSSLIKYFWNTSSAKHREDSGSSEDSGDSDNDNPSLPTSNSLRPLKSPVKTGTKSSLARVPMLRKTPTVEQAVHGNTLLSRRLPASLRSYPTENSSATTILHKKNQDLENDCSIVSDSLMSSELSCLQFSNSSSKISNIKNSLSKDETCDVSRFSDTSASDEKWTFQPPHNSESRSSQSSEHILAVHQLSTQMLKKFFQKILKNGYLSIRN